MDYEDTIDFAREHGYVHESELPNFDLIKDHLTGIIEAVYETGDVAMLESCLDEVCHQFDIKITDKQPKIQKKQIPLMEWYLDVQKGFLQ